MLPQWVTTTSTLECIDLENCRELLELPKGIGNLKRLIVLNIKGCDKLHYMPSGLGQLTRLRKLGLFVVGCGEDESSISELENLDKLSGQLKISNVKYLKDPADAGKCYLKQMNNILSLVLDWSLSETEEELVFDMEKEQGILRALEPPPQIKKLEINGYQGSCFPRWMMAQNDSCFCEAIMLKQTGPCQFLSLTELRLRNCPNMKQMRGLWVLPSLKSLFLIKMANLEELWTITSDSGNSGEEIRGQCCFPALSDISISGCPRLNVKPHFPPSLEKLHLSKSSMQLLSAGSFSQMLPPSVDTSSSSYSMHSAVPHLRELRLTITASSPGLEFLQNHTELETLSIKYCYDMTELPESIRSLTSLRKLSIFECTTLGLLPDWLGELCSLRSLSVLGTPMMQSLPQSTKHLRSLVALNIWNWDNNLNQLPDVIEHLTSLEVLNLMGFAALTELPEWIGQLTALRELYIQSFPALEFLPQSIQRLTALKVSYISHCPDLERRYKRRVGPDWHLVSHIPELYV
jgi:Leucine-rich repeat (LRR) protein